MQTATHARHAQAPAPMLNPLYGLRYALANEDYQVIVCQGQAAADTLNALLDKLPVAAVAYVGADKVDEREAINLTDWAPLAGRSVVIVGSRPIGDELGIMLTLRRMGCTGKFCWPEADKPDGWTVTSHQWADQAELLAWLKSTAVPWPDAPEPVDSVESPESSSQAMLGGIDRVVPPSSLATPPDDEDPDIGLDEPEPGQPPEWLSEAPDGPTIENRPLSAAEAYQPYRKPQTAAKWPLDPTDWWSEGKVPEMPPEVMPPCLRDYILHESETIGADRGIMALYILGFCAGALSDSHVLQVKPDNPRWQEPARLWLMVVGSSASKKSPALKEVRGPAWKLELAMRQRSIADVERWTEETEIYTKQREAYISASAKGNAAVAPEKPKPPNRERMLVGNATVESLADVLFENERGVVNVMDEIVSILKGMGQYKKGGNDKEAYLMGFDGGPYPVDRKGVATLIPNFGWSLIGGTQQSKIRQVAASLSLESDGFMQRFIPYIARNASEDLDRPAHHDGHALYSDILSRLWEMQSHGPVLFSESAQAVRREFSGWAWQTAKDQWLGDSLRSAISKYDTQYARLCLLYHAIACAADHRAILTPEISADTAMQVAALFRRCLYPHAENFYLHILEGSTEQLQHVRYLAGKILAKAPTEINVSWIAHGWTKWRTLPDWTKRGILTMLVDAGWIWSDDARGFVAGRPITYQVNPNLQHVFASYADAERAYLEGMAERRAERIAGED